MNYWNIFARELQRVLAQYDMGLGHLDDRFAIHREKVRRLTQSLFSPPTLPVLNRKEMQLLAEEIPLSENDLLQLRAALLATSIQQLVKDRANIDSARLAAEQVFPLLLNALITHTDTQGLDAIRGGDRESQEYKGFDHEFDTIYDALDRGEQALSLSYDSFSRSACFREASQAREAFEEALQALGQLTPALRRSPQYQQLRQDVQNCLRETSNRLELLSRQTS